MVNFMSLAHIRLVQEVNSPTCSEYRVECPDMGESRQWQEVGKLRFEKAASRYDFIPAKVWIEKRALPPALYNLPELEQKRLLGSDYAGMSWGTWAMIIHHYASGLLERKDYPLRYPEMMFK